VDSPIFEKTFLAWSRILLLIRMLITVFMFL
jgi:hypothetical protein